MRNKRRQLKWTDYKLKITFWYDILIPRKLEKTINAFSNTNNDFQIITFAVLIWRLPCTREGKLNKTQEIKT